MGLILVAILFHQVAIFAAFNFGLNGSFFKAAMMLLATIGICGFRHVALVLYFKRQGGLA